MTTVSATIVTIVVLASAGLFPAVALTGLRLITVPLVPLAGAVIAALAATGFIAVGGSFIGWFVALAVTGVVVVAGCWALRPAWRPWRGSGGPPSLAGGGCREWPEWWGRSSSWGRRRGASGRWPPPRWDSTPGHCG